MTTISEFDELRTQLPGPPGPRSLVSFTIAGVQEFLAAARTTRDVWNGSYLLSFLAFRATEAMLQEVQRLTGSPNLKDVYRFAILPSVETQPLFRRAVGDTVSDSQTTFVRAGDRRMHSITQALFPCDLCPAEPPY